MMKNSMMCVVLLLLAQGIAAASPPCGCFFSDDDSVTQTSRATLNVYSSLPGVRVFVDTLAVGPVPLESCAIDTGKHILHFIHPDGNRWLYPAITETIVVHPMEHIERTVHFSELYLLASEPYGATVQWNDSILGQTPLRISLPSSPSVITMIKEGFQKETIPLSSDMHEVHAVLQPLPGATGSSSSLYLGREQSKSSLPLYLTTGATVLAGATAAYFKIKADNSYHDYLKNGDQSSLDRVHTFDTISGVSLVVGEVNLLMLTYFLLSR